MAPAAASGIGVEQRGWPPLRQHRHLRLSQPRPAARGPLPFPAAPFPFPAAPPPLQIQWMKQFVGVMQRLPPHLRASARRGSFFWRKPPPPPGPPKRGIGKLTQKVGARCAPRTRAAACALQRLPNTGLGDVAVSGSGGIGPHRQAHTLSSADHAHFSTCKT
jgi:hypothetical protein